MNTVNLALGGGLVLVAGWALFGLRRGRVRARLARLSRAPAVPTRGSPAPGRFRRPLAARAETVVTERPVVSAMACTAVVGGVALLLGGPVGGIVLGLYTAMAVAGGRRIVMRRAADRAVLELLDRLDAAIGDLRAGIAPGATEPAVDPPARASRRQDAAVTAAMARLGAAHRLSEALGMPLADLLDRVDTDLRAGQALRADVAAQTSGAQATAVVLLALPVVGLWVGAALGADPVAQLLHTPLGAGCAILAALLQCGGLLWTARMIQSVQTEVRR